MIDLEVRNSETMKTSNVDQDKSPCGPTGSEDKKNEFILTFDNFVDLQSRLVLLPLNDAECTGAVIDSYISRDLDISEGVEEDLVVQIEGPITPVLECNHCQENTDDTVVENKMHDEKVNDITNEKREEIISTEEVLKQVGSGERSESDQEKEVDRHAMEIGESQGESNSNNLNDKKKVNGIIMEKQSDKIDAVLGSTLKKIPGLTGHEETEWTTQDFTEILSLLRDAPAPISLLFNSSNKQRIKNEVEDQFKKHSSGSIDCSSTEEGMTDRDTLSSSSSSYSSSSDSSSEGEECGETGANALKGRLQRWGSQLQQKKTVLAEEAWKAANVARESAKEKSEQEIIAKKTKHETCGMFLQTSTGKCIPLSPSLYTNKSRFRKSPPVITNTSVLVIRTSAQKPCPTIGYKFQWFRCQSKVQLHDSDDREGREEWCHLEGATSVVFQPSATDVGHRIKCTIESVNTVGISLTATCELPFPIQLDKTLFTAAMKSFTIPQDLPGVHRSSFGNMVGTGKFDRIPFHINMHLKQDHYEGTQGGFFMTISSKGTVSESCK